MTLRILLLPLLLPLSFLFGVLAFFRGLFYSLGIFPTFGFPTVRVISIGNISSGGTGKTPLSLSLLSEAKKRGVNAFYVSRGYGRRTKGYIEIKTSSAPAQVSDEALLIKSKFPEVPAAVCENRVTAIEKLLSLTPEGFFDIPYQKEGEVKPLVIADDCFQHRRLRRDLDVVLLDMTAPMWSYLPLPLGLGREGFAALKRAKAVLLTRCESVTPEEIISMKKRLVVLGVKNFFTSRFTIDQTLNLSDGQPTNIKEPVLLLSSVGNPQSFKRMVESTIKVVDHKVYPDHYEYTASDLESIEGDLKNKSAQCVLITEKDAVKINSLTKNKQNYLVAPLKIEIDNQNQFYDLIFNEEILGGG